jgi:hypothetical protein
MTEAHFRALCAELAACLQGRKDLECGWPGEDPEQELLDRARAALAQPEPHGVTDEEIDDQFFAHRYTDDFGNELMEIQQFRKSARAVLARCGTSNNTINQED